MNPEQQQQIFRTLLSAMSAPGEIMSIPARPEPAPLSPACAGVCLTLLDASSAVALTGMAPTVAPWLNDHCRAPMVSLDEAQFVLGMGKHWNWESSQAPIGSEEEPEQGATLILELDNLNAGIPLQLTGPGISGTRNIAPRLGTGFLAFWQKQQSQYPRGVDLILCSQDQCLCLPRSVTICRFEEA
ncbi:phosphonate C-P lyase system protein PhnH [Acidithiobacillus marinus]|uniref:Phosphonate C-P lyase system protein PhnH n=1 Tax=Acidithiobacillus marinus TaxID=187490 RepID=A0A2I1DMP9_9PROT|nr:phosphonate C-P lyase system protein PhnH [Acidithiobacillus marinus]PKY11156.1 phosphonate C-P lyase system protein PhnH [Acidithiobacillus marinus]